MSSNNRFRTLKPGKSVKATVDDLLSSKQQTGTVRDEAVDMLEFLAAAETDVSLWRWWRPKTELKESEYRMWKYVVQKWIMLMLFLLRMWPKTSMITGL